MKILAIESTCDETAAAVVESCGKGVRVLKNVVASSSEMHQKYGGIVPEVAAREQIKSIIPVINEALVGELSNVDAVSVSYGPGLMGSLLVGVETAKILSLIWNKPLIAVNHMTAHILANWIIEDEFKKTPVFPAVCLVVSGGHTDLFLMKDINNWKWIGGTRDDAAGEAFDKAARILGLPYPGGPSIQKTIEGLDASEHVSKELKLPRPMINEGNLEMSFSGLKAALLRTVDVNQITANKDLSLIAKDFNQAVVEIFAKKCSVAIEKYKPKSFILAGGVSANSLIREELKSVAERSNIDFYVPELKYCGDNAAMVGAAAILKPINVEPHNLKADPGLII